MLAGGIVEGRAGVDGRVSAFLAYNHRPGVSLSLIHISEPTRPY